MDELIIGEKRYVSSKRAAEITGYAKDYVGQLCREGFVEAKMVGRSWYVLESSIHEHRFGPEEAPAAASREAVEEDVIVPEVQKPVYTWEPPKYVTEMPEMLPKADAAPVLPAAESAKKGSPEAAAAISDMQAAWKEWFERKQEPLLESPEVIEAREEAHEELEETDYAREAEEEVVPIRREQSEEAVREDLPVAVPVHKIAPVAPVGAAKVEIRPVRREYASPAPAPVTPIVRHYKAPKPRASIVGSALLLGACLLIVAVTVIGTGYMEQYGTQNSALDFLGGTSRLEK